MTKSSKIKLYCFMFAITLLVFSCKKKDDKDNSTPPNNTTPYSSMTDFYAANEVKAESFTVDASAGGNFVTAKGTKVTIAPNTLAYEDGTPVTGDVTVSFKDIYKKSDMLLSDMPTTQGNGKPLKSGGEFFISIIKNGQGVKIANGQAIQVEQPLNNQPLDTAMKPFVWGKGAGGDAGWNNSGDSMSFSASSYIFSLYNFSVPVSGGTWCNSDNPTYFSSYTQTTLTIIPDVDPAAYKMDVYLIFDGINSMVHVYHDGNGQFPYAYAPETLSCTIVAVGIKDSKLYASYTPITITTAKTVHVSLAETTETDFKNKLNTLNN